MQIVTTGNDLEGIEPSKSFRNAEDSVPYGVRKENDKLQYVPQKILPEKGKDFIIFLLTMFNNVYMINMCL